MSPTGACLRRRVIRAEGTLRAWSKLYGASGWACEWGIAGGLGEADSQPSTGVERMTCKPRFEDPWRAAVCIQYQGDDTIIIV